MGSFFYNLELSAVFQDGPQPHAPTHLGDRTFSYDANGNQVDWSHDKNGTRRNITWDEENRIQAIADNGHTMTYTYDASGQRITKRGPQGETGYINQWMTLRNGEVGTKHVFAGTSRVVSKLVKQDKPNTKRNSSNNKKNGQGKARIVYEKDQYYYHPDHLGTTAYITHTNGQIYQHLEYFPFGETWVEEHSNKQRTPYLFTAKELDEETGLYYFGARYYDPRTSVWQSTDPKHAEYFPRTGSNPDNLPGAGGIYRSVNINMFRYAAQNPLSIKDPDGRTDIYDQSGRHVRRVEDNKQTVSVQLSDIKTKQKFLGADFVEIGDEKSGIFNEFVGTVAQESSGNLEESKGIADVVNNRAKESGRSIKSILRNSGVYGNKEANTGDEVRTSEHSGMQNARAAVIDVYLGGNDDSRGAYFWEGLIFLQNENNFFTKRMQGETPVFSEIFKAGRNVEGNMGTSFMKYNPDNPEYGDNVWP